MIPILSDFTMSILSEENLDLRIKAVIKPAVPPPTIHNLFII
jgi:hypothetical protein